MVTVHKLVAYLQTRRNPQAKQQKVMRWMVGLGILWVIIAIANGVSATFPSDTDLAFEHCYEFYGYTSKTAPPALGQECRALATHSRL
jgi:uncharacterized membrane protein